MVSVLRSQEIFVHTRNKTFDVEAGYKGVPSPLKGQEFFREDRILNLI